LRTLFKLGKNLKNNINLRKEYKIILSDLELTKFMKIYRKNLNPLYDTRTITSLYYDTLSFDLYHKSMNYDVDTFKVRLRTYSNTDEFYEEIKSNLYYGKEKTVKKRKINSFEDVQKIFIKGNVLYPSAFTSYERSYYKFHNTRLTIDKNICYTSHKFRSLSLLTKFEPQIVLEIKSFDGNLDVEKYLFRTPSAFSKYKNAINSLYRLN